MKKDRFFGENLYEKKFEKKHFFRGICGASVNCCLLLNNHFLLIGIISNKLNH